MGKDLRSSASVPDRRMTQVLSDLVLGVRASQFGSVSFIDPELAALAISKGTALE